MLNLRVDLRNSTGCAGPCIGLGRELARALESTSGTSVIHLIGPSGAGKSTTGRILADLLRCPFRDLDRLFEERHGDIDEAIRIRGYAAYARLNVETYCAMTPCEPSVLALSSGFMTYPDSIYPEMPTIRRSLVTRSSTFVLLPSLDVEECVSETVRRQRERPLKLHRTDDREEDVIRERFPIYAALAARKVSTMRPPPEIAAEILTLLGFPSPAHHCSSCVISDER
jgi:shikimate kinase